MEELETTGFGTEAAAVAQLAAERDAALAARDDGRLVTRIIPDGYRIETQNLELYDAAPDQKRGTVRVHTPAALISYTQRHLSPAHSTLWADVDQGSVTVVLNDHANAPDFAGWADHRTVLQLRPTEEWAAWTERNEKDLAQTALALFLEEHVRDVVDPAGAVLLEVARTLNATVGATFKSAVSLATGERKLVWEEEVSASAGRNKDTSVPSTFVVRMAPFDGAPIVDVQGMFRYRVSAGTLVLGYRLLHLEQHRQDAVRAVVGLVAQAVELEPIEGVAPAVRR